MGIRGVVSKSVSVMRKCRIVGSGERGAAAAPVALLTVVLPGFAALAVDVGNTYWQAPSFPTSNSVKETTSAGKDGSGLDLFFAPILGTRKAAANATASAAWGSPIRGNTVLPVALSRCEFTEYGFRGSTEFLMRYDNAPSERRQAVTNHTEGVADV